jgi:endonuclease/exonuclease/phosphatase family metal-dependent hydrolase
MKKTRKTEVLRIANYNILNGGKGRLKDISKVIREINPDICGILEAVDWQHDEKFFKTTANELGYKFFKIAVANSKYNIAIFSKISLGIKIIRKGFRHVVLKATIKNGLFKDFDVYFIHLSPISEDYRLLEVRKLLRHIKKSDKAIIMGDFNSLSSYDPYDKKSLLKIFQKNGIKKYGTDKLRFDVIKKIKSVKLVDAMNYLKKPFITTTPTSSNKDINHIANIRIDYAFFTKNILKYLKRMEVFKSSSTERASDHYPLFIELSV